MFLINAPRGPVRAAASVPRPSLRNAPNRMLFDSRTFKAIPEGYPRLPAEMIPTRFGLAATGSGAFAQDLFNPYQASGLTTITDGFVIVMVFRRLVVGADGYGTLLVFNDDLGTSVYVFYDPLSAYNSIDCEFSFGGTSDYHYQTLPSSVGEDLSLAISAYVTPTGARIAMAVNGQVFYDTGLAVADLSFSPTSFKVRSDYVSTPARHLAAHRLAAVLPINVPPAQLARISADPFAAVYGASSSPIWVPGLPVEAVTITRPNSDVVVSGWTGVPDNSTLYNNLDEETASDTDYVVSPDLSAASPITFGLTQPLAAGTWDVRVRARRTATAGELRVLLLDESNAVVGTGAWTALTTIFADYALPVPTTGTATRVRIEVRA